MDNGITTPRPRPSIARTPTTPPSLSNPRTLFHAVRERTRPIPNPNVIPTVGSAASSHPSHSAPSTAREKKERKRKNKSQRKQKNEAPDNLVETLFFSPFPSFARSIMLPAPVRGAAFVAQPTLDIPREILLFIVAVYFITHASDRLYVCYSRVRPR